MAQFATVPRFADKDRDRENKPMVYTLHATKIILNSKTAMSQKPNNPGNPDKPDKPETPTPPNRPVDPPGPPQTPPGRDNKPKPQPDRTHG